MLSPYKPNAQLIHNKFNQVERKKNLIGKHITFGMRMQQNCAWIKRCSTAARCPNLDRYLSQSYKKTILTIL